MVAGVPGRIEDPAAGGVNLLIRDGAQAITTVEDLLGLYGLSTIGKGSGLADDWCGVGEDLGLAEADEGGAASLKVESWRSLMRELGN